jgi:hypothetical protein
MSDTAAPTIRTGDTVKHLPSGEYWLVGFSGNGWIFSATGQKGARMEEIELVEACTDEEHRSLAGCIAKMQVGAGRRVS